MRRNSRKKIVTNRSSQSYSAARSKNNLTPEQSSQVNKSVPKPGAIVFVIFVFAIVAIPCCFYAVLESAPTMDEVSIREHIDNSKNESISFEWMLYPVNVSTFFSKFWERKPLLIQRWSGYYSDQIKTNLRDLDAIFSVQKIIENAPFFLHPKTRTSQANCEWVKHGMDSIRSSYPSLYHAYLDGATIFCHLLPAYWKPLATLVQSLEVRIRMFATKKFLTLTEFLSRIR